MCFSAGTESLNVAFHSVAICSLFALVCFRKLLETLVFFVGICMFAPAHVHASFDNLNLQCHWQLEKEGKKVASSSIRHWPALPQGRLGSMVAAAWSVPATRIGGGTCWVCSPKPVYSADQCRLCCPWYCNIRHCWCEESWLGACRTGPGLTVVGKEKCNQRFSRFYKNLWVGGGGLL